MEIPLETLNSDIVIDICANQCESKCCNFYTSDFHARVNIEDYKLLKRHDLEQFVVWDHGDPQLASQPDGKCIFLNPDTYLCSIYEIRPLDCRNFPYFMPKENIPSHCILYKQSSDELIEKEKSKTNDVPPFNKRYNELDDIEIEYIANLQAKPSLDFDSLFDKEIEISSDHYYFSILYFQEEHAEIAESTIDRYLNEDHGNEYMVYSIIGISADHEYIYHIQGIWRDTENTLIPHIQNFPPTVDEFRELLEWVNSNYTYLRGGIETNQKINSTFTSKIEN